ncbi:unnamed protein product, partial [Prorocentrum cordatum]
IRRAPTAARAGARAAPRPGQRRRPRLGRGCQDVVEDVLGPLRGQGSPRRAGPGFVRPAPDAGRPRCHHPVEQRALLGHRDGFFRRRASRPRGPGGAGEPSASHSEDAEDAEAGPAAAGQGEQLGGEQLPGPPGRGRG